jgi:hypothetical protein
MPESTEQALLFSAATKALALRWIQLARETLETKFRAKSEVIMI